MNRTHAQALRAFSLVELLVVIGIIAVLIGILMPALSAARKASLELRSLSGLRQMMLGYMMYGQDNNQAVLWGYAPATVDGWTVTVSDPISGQTFGYPLSARYPWRLVPYVQNLWSIIHSHDDLPPLPQPGDSASVAFLKAYTLSLDPTYGINAIFVGGDADEGGFNGDQPNVGHGIVFRVSDVTDASNLIVFADCQADVASLEGQGYHLLQPPNAGGLGWTVGSDGQAVASNPDVIMGLPRGWYTKRVMTAFFDGHAEALLPNQMTDMRTWNNWASGPDDNSVP